MKKSLVTIALCSFIFPALSLASQTISSSEMYVPKSGIFIGFGGSYNSVKLDQNVNLIGTSNVYSGNTLVAYGQAQGPANPFHDTQSTFAPQGQIGYFRNFTDSNWLWGVKLLYQYLNVTATDQDIVAPQVGILTLTGSAPVDTTFTGHAIIQSAQTRVTHELLLIPFIGCTIKNSYLYLGIGPSLFDTQSKFYNVTGYADVNGVHLDVSGTPANFSSAKWMWGGAAQVGMTYYFDSTWNLDMNYTYAVTGKYTTNYTGTFTSISGAYVTSGDLFGSSAQRVTAQSFGISINKVFA
jgi:hypothetical protein